MQIEGRNPIIEALRSKKSQITKLYIQKTLEDTDDPKIEEIKKLAQDNHLKINYIDKKSLDKIAKSGVHQGVLAKTVEKGWYSVKSLIKKVEAENKIPFFIMVREAMYSHNLGAIIRSAVCAGANGIIIPPTDDVDENAIRASMGATEYIDIAKDSLFSAIKDCQELNVRVIGIEVLGKHYYYESDLTGPVCFIIGGEDKPLTSDIVEKCDDCVKIPLLSPINSLNLSVAASVVMYEKVRQELI